MILPRLFNHGILRSIKKENNKLVLEGTTGKVEFEDSGLPSIGESDAGKVLMVDDGEAKWLWQLPPGSAGQFLKRTGTGQNFAFSSINEVPTEGTAGQVLKKTSDGYGWADAPSSSTPFAMVQVQYQDYIDLAFQTADTTVTFNLNDVSYPSGDNHIPAEGSTYNLMIQFYNEDSYLDATISQLTKRMNNEIHIVTVFQQNGHYGILDFQTFLTNDPDTPFENSALKVTKLV